jgi:hypothetical protein
MVCWCGGVFSRQNADVKAILFSFHNFQQIPQFGSKKQKFCGKLPHHRDSGARNGSALSQD